MSIDIGAIVRDADARLDRACRDGRKDFSLRVTGHLEEEGWIYLIVAPSRDGVHSEDYIDIARKVEETMPSVNGHSVLFVPARPQD